MKPLNNIIVGRKQTGLVKFKAVKEAEAYIKTKKRTGINLTIIQKGKVN